MDERKDRMYKAKVKADGSRGYLTSDKLLNLHQSAYCKRHSTEPTLLHIHDNLVNAIGLQQLSCLCLLDLSAAFDTIDHSMLLTRVSSSIGIHFMALSSTALSPTCCLAASVTDVITLSCPCI